MKRYNTDDLDELEDQLTSAEESTFETLYLASDMGVPFGSYGSDTALFLTDHIEWLIDLGLVEKTGDYEADRTVWALTDEGLALAEDYFG